MSLRIATEIVIVAVAAALIAWDVFAMVRGGDSATISDVLLTSARQHPIIPFALGVLMGHLFWSQQ